MPYGRPFWSEGWKWPYALCIILHKLPTQAIESGGEKNNGWGNGGPYTWHPAESFKSSSKIIPFRKNTSESLVTSSFVKRAEATGSHTFTLRAKNRATVGWHVRWKHATVTKCGEGQEHNNKIDINKCYTHIDKNKNLFNISTASPIHQDAKMETKWRLKFSDFSTNKN